MHTVLTPHQPMQFLKMVENGAKTVKLDLWYLTVGINQIDPKFWLEHRLTFNCYNVYQWPEGDCPGANRGRFFRHSSLEDPAKNTHRTFPSRRPCLDHNLP
jgi:hypothetical protein